MSRATTFLCVARFRDFMALQIFSSLSCFSSVLFSSHQSTQLDTLSHFLIFFPHSLSLCFVRPTDLRQTHSRAGRRGEGIIVSTEH